MKVILELQCSPQLNVPLRYLSSQFGVFGTKANTESGCVDADELFRPRGSECVCEYPCRFLGIF